MEPGRLLVGRVVKPHGIRGELVVEVLSDAPDRFAAGVVVGAGDPDGDLELLTVASARAHQGRMLVAFEEIPDRSAAERYRGTTLSIPAEEARPLPEGSYYPFQLEGLAVVDPAGTVLGRMVRVEENPANDLWVVDDGTKEVLVPAVSEIVREVDLESRRIVVDPPGGLFD